MQGKITRGFISPLFGGLSDIQDHEYFFNTKAIILRNSGLEIAQPMNEELFL